MIRIKDVTKHGYTGAGLDETGNPYKLVCDALNVVTWITDSETAPMAMLTVTYCRVDTSRQYERAGPMTQHYITGDELALILDANPTGPTVEEIEASTLRTGIPSANILPEDLEADPSLPVWSGQALPQQLRDTVEKIKEERVKRAPQIPVPLPPREVTPGPSHPETPPGKPLEPGKPPHAGGPKP